MDEKKILIKEVLQGQCWGWGYRLSHFMCCAMTNLAQFTQALRHLIMGRARTAWCFRGALVEVAMVVAIRWSPRAMVVEATWFPGSMVMAGWRIPWTLATALLQDMHVTFFSGSTTVSFVYRNCRSSTIIFLKIRNLHFHYMGKETRGVKTGTVVI